MSKHSKFKLIREYKIIKETPNRKLFSSPFDNNLFSWKAICIGPYLTPINECLYKLILYYPKDYPFSPPFLKLLFQKSFHPNIYSNGAICLDILQKKWMAGFSTSTILTSLQSFFFDPNIDSPANLNASNLFQKNRFRYFIKIAKFCRKSWKF